MRQAITRAPDIPPLDRRSYVTDHPHQLLAALLVACGTQSANQAVSTQARIACAHVGIDPGAAFGQCASDLDQSLWDEQVLADR